MMSFVTKQRETAQFLWTMSNCDFKFQACRVSNVTLNVTLGGTESKLEEETDVNRETAVVCFFWFVFFLVYEISAAFFWNWQREMLTPRLGIPAGLERALLVPAWLCVTDLRGCNINQALRALRKFFESVAT